MAIRDDINYSMMTEIQRFREDLLTEEEKKEIEDDVMAFCIIEIRKFCGADIFERKQQELQEKGIDKLRQKVQVDIKKKS